jgi:hypothetical protein
LTFRFMLLLRLVRLMRLARLLLPLLLRVCSFAL